MHTARSALPVFVLATALTCTPLATPSPAFGDIAMPNSASCRQPAAANPNDFAALAASLGCAQARPQRQIAVQLASETTDAATQIGVADSNLYDLDHAGLTARLTELQSIGVTNLRVAVPWVYIQPTATTYDWAKMDSLVETASAMGFTVTGAISGNPVWGGLPIAGAPNPTAYGKFAGAVAERYGSKISTFEIWNEPNGVVFYAPVSAASYTAVLKAAYTAIKAVNPSATVLAGSLGATSNVYGISVTPQRFLAQMYEAGAAGYFDALSYHPYHYTLPFSAGAGIANSPLEQVRQLYALMVANGDGDLKIWATEYGNATTPGWGVTQTEQAALMRDFITAWSRLSYSGPAFVYTAQDLATGILNHELNFGLFTSSGNAKLAAQVIAQLIAQSALGELPDYTAPKMTLARELYLQLASVGFGLANQALVIPNAVIALAYDHMPAVVRRAFQAVSKVVSQVAAAVVTAAAPVVQSAIASLLSMAPNTTKAEDDAESTGQQGDSRQETGLPNVGDVIAGSLRDTQLTLQGYVRDTGLTVAGALRDVQLTIDGHLQASNPHDQSVTATPLGTDGTAAAEVTAPVVEPGSAAALPATELEHASEPGEEVVSAAPEPVDAAAAAQPSLDVAVTTAPERAAAPTVKRARTSPRSGLMLSAGSPAESAAPRGSLASSEAEAAEGPSPRAPRPAASGASGSRTDAAGDTAKASGPAA